MNWNAVICHATCIAADASWLSQELDRWESQAFSLWMWEHIHVLKEWLTTSFGLVTFAPQRSHPFLQLVVLPHFRSDRCELQSLECGSWLLYVLLAPGEVLGQRYFPRKYTDTINCLILWLRQLKQKQIMSFQGQFLIQFQLKAFICLPTCTNPRGGSVACEPHLITPALLHTLLHVVPTEARWEGHCGPCLLQGQRLKIPASWYLRRPKEWS